jgi:hypothetical protein
VAKLITLYSEQTPELRKKITSALAKFQVVPGVSLTSDKAKEIFFSLPEKIRTAYLKALDDTYLLTEVSMMRTFGSDLQAVLEHGLYLRMKLVGGFAPSSEYIGAVAHTKSLAYLLTFSHPIAIQKLVPTRVKRLPREEQIAELFMSNGECANIKELAQRTRATAYDIAQRLYQHKNLIGPSSSSLSNAQLKKLLVEELSDVCAAGALFILDEVDSRYRGAYIHPSIADTVYAEFQKLETGIGSEMLTKAEEPVVPSSSVYHHLDFDGTRRRIILFLSYLLRKEVHRTNEGHFKKSDIQRIAKSFARSPEQIAVEAIFYDLIAPYIDHVLYSEGIVPKIDSSFAVFSEVLLREKIEERFRYYSNTLEPFLRDLPTDRWIGEDTVDAYARTATLALKRGYVSTGLLFDRAVQGAFFFAEFDLAYDKKVKCITAFRKVAPPSDPPVAFAESDLPLTMQKNLEVIIPPTIAHTQLLHLYTFFSLRDLSTLVLNDTVIVRLKDAGFSTPEKMVATLEQLLGTALPANARDFIERSCSANKEVIYTDLKCVRVEDAALTSKLRVALAPHVLFELGNGLFLIRPFVLPSEIKKAIKESGGYCQSYEYDDYKESGFYSTYTSSRFEAQSGEYRKVDVLGRFGYKVKIVKPAPAKGKKQKAARMVGNG